jgi:TRAP transporter TAXI family solute receptor
MVKERLGAKMSLGLVLTVLLLAISTTVFAQKMKISYGGTSASSGSYISTVTVCKAINDGVPEVNVTNVETGASVENARLLIRGDVDFCLMDVSIQDRLWNGLEEFKGRQNQTIRNLWLTTVIPHTVFVTKESGITSINQLTGKKFSPGFTGSATASLAVRLFEANGIKPVWYRSGLSAMVDAVKNRELVGYVKSGFPDTTVQDIASLIPIVLLPITDEAMAKGNAKYPGMFVKTIGPAKSYQGQDQDVPTYPVIMHDTGTTKLSEDLVYKMCKAFYNARDKIAKSYKYANVALDFPKSMLIGPIPIHAGTYKFCKEMGVPVPERLIPPEAKR